MTEIFKAFLESGEFPGVSNPITIESLIADLGPPSDTARLDAAWIYKYGAAQFILDDCGTVDFFIYFWSLVDSDSPIDVEPLSSVTTLYDLIELLNDASLQWEIDQELSLGDQVTVMTEGGVRLIFDLLHTELDKLWCGLQQGASNG